MNYNSAALLKQNLEGLLEEGLPPGTEIILVDNGEEDEGGEVDLVDRLGKRLLEGVLCIKNKKNIGFGPACNLAVRRASGEFVLFLNPDCLISVADIQKMAGHLGENPSLGVLGPRITNKQGRDLPWSCGEKIDYWDRIFLSRKEKMALAGSGCFNGMRGSALNNSLAPAIWLSGACMMVRKEVFGEIGGFDERFFMYFEDRDFCLRAIQKAFCVARLVDASAVHLESKSALCWSLRKKMYYKSQGRFFLKHYGILAFVVLMILRLPRYVRNVYWGG